MNRSKGNEIDQKNSTELSKEKEFQPTPAMIVWLDTQIESGSDVVAEIARQAKLTEQAWYKWLKTVEGFEDWYWAEYDKRTRRWKPTVDAIGLKFARKGSAEHFKYLAQRVGNIKEQGNTNIQINVTPIVDDPIYVSEGNSDQKDIQS